jgi:metal-responsive CopG/Arc/MetJ family transcriptional regulator
VRVKASITLPRDLLQSIDRHGQDRSAFIEQAARAYPARLNKARRGAADVRIIDRNANRLNREAEDVLEYQRLR